MNECAFGVDFCLIYLFVSAYLYTYLHADVFEYT